jgi:multidrug efflux pump
MNMRITFMDMNTMQVKSIPISAVATVDYTNTSGAIARKNVKRTIQLQSNVLDPSMTGKVNEELAVKIDDFKAKNKIPPDVTIRQVRPGRTGKRNKSFLGMAFFIALGLIFLILVLQFNSLSKPFIVLTEIFFSVIGVLLGYAFTGMTIATIMLLVGMLVLQVL